jgi:(2Fe-2S) ferredoxin
MEKQSAPSWIHVFVCVNDRNQERPSCADKDAVEIHARLKDLTKAKGWANGKVRVSKCGCLGLCGQGPNVLIHPEKIHFSKVTLDDIPEIEAAIEALLL